MNRASVRVGLIGCGAMGQGHARTLAAGSAIKLVALADITEPNLQGVGDEHQIPENMRFVDYRDLVAVSDIDVVVVATPPWVRKESVMAALHAGKHVLAEKPLAVTPKDAWEMVDAAQRAERVLGMGHNYLFFPEFEVAKAALDAGAIGDIQVVVANFLGVPDVEWSAPERTFRAGWRHELGLAGGGVLMDMIHSVYLASWLAGASVRAVSSSVRHDGRPWDTVENLALCRLYFDDAYAVVNVGWGTGPGGIQVSGSKGRLWINYKDLGTAPFDEFDSMYVFDGDEKRQLSVPDRRPPYGRDRMLTDFLDAIRKGRSPRSSGEDGARALEAVLASYASSARGRTVPLPLDPSDPVYQQGAVALRHHAPGP